jgi:hypothetical protein
MWVAAITYLIPHFQWGQRSLLRVKCHDESRLRMGFLSDSSIFRFQKLGTSELKASPPAQLQDGIPVLNCPATLVGMSGSPSVPLWMNCSGAGPLNEVLKYRTSWSSCSYSVDRHEYGYRVASTALPFAWNKRSILSILWKADYHFIVTRDRYGCD